MLLYSKKYLIVTGIFIFLILFLFNCSCFGDKTENFLKKADFFFEHEQFDKSEFFMHKAYESTFADLMFPLGKISFFSKLKGSRQNSTLVLSLLEQKKKSLFVYDRATEKNNKFLVTLGMLDYTLSPNGKYIVVLEYVQKEHYCTFSVYKVDTFSKNIKVQRVFSGLNKDIRVSCLQSIGISNLGLVSFASGNQLQQLDIKTESTTDLVKYLSKLFSTDVKVIYQTFFYYLKDNILVFTIGNAGKYQLYRYADNVLSKLNSNLSEGKILFSSAETLFIKEGSAGNYHFRGYNFSNPFDFKRIGVIKDISFWKGVSFVNESSFTYVIDELLVYSNNNEEYDLPFFAIQTHLTPDGTILFLSKIGSFIKYTSSINLTKESLSVFQKIQGLELDANEH